MFGMLFFLLSNKKPKGKIPFGALFSSFIVYELSEILNYFKITFLAFTIPFCSTFTI